MLQRAVADGTPEMENLAANIRADVLRRAKFGQPKPSRRSREQMIQLVQAIGESGYNQRAFMTQYLMLLMNAAKVLPEAEADDMVAGVLGFKEPI
jgi:hypothetical protein